MKDALRQPIGPLGRFATKFYSIMVEAALAGAYFATT